MALRAWHRTSYPPLLGHRYDLWQSGDLLDWQQAEGFPKVADGLSMGHPLTVAPGGQQFFKIVPIDEQPPMVVAQYPAVDGFAVSLFADLALELEDATGLNPASIRLTVGGIGPLAPGAPGLTISGNTITYDSGDAALGAWGETVTATLVAADLLGNTLTHIWSFRLEPEPVVASNVFVFGSSTAQRTGQRVSGPAAARTSGFTAPSGPVKANDGQDWSIDSVATDRIVIAYGANGPPSFTADQLLCNLAPAKESEIFYRKVLSISNDAAASKLILMTEDAPLTEFVTQGAAALSEDSVIYELDGTGSLVRALSFDGTLTFPRIGRDLNDTGITLLENGFEISVNGTTYSHGTGSPRLECSMSEFSWWFTPRIRAAFELHGRTLRSFEAVASGQVESSMAFVGSVIAPLSAGPWTLFDLPDSMEPKWIVYMQVGLVPIWAVVSFDFEIEAEAEAQAAMSFHALSRQSTNASFGVTYKEGSGVEFIQSFQNGTPVASRGAEVTAEASVTVSLEPEIEFVFYGLAGFEAGIEPSATLSVKLDPETKICFDTALDFVLEPAGPVFDRMGITGEIYRNIASSSSCDEFSFTTHPASQTVKEKTDVVFECVVDAPEGRQKDVTFQWFHDGVAIPGQTNRNLFLTRVRASHAGSYHVTATLDETTIGSETAALTVGDGPVLGEFALIPAGSFQMGDSFNTWWDAERPVHTVHISAFYMGRYEVAKVLWDEVRAWGITNGYPDLPLGSGKAADHPVHTISWYSMLKWSNARSERDGLTPCYMVGESVYRAGSDSNVVCNWNANGYRLPTEAEWEKAARGGGRVAFFLGGIRSATGRQTIGLPAAMGIKAGAQGIIRATTRVLYPTRLLLGALLRTVMGCMM